MKSKLPSWPRTSPNTKFCFIGKLPARLICNDFKSKLLRRAFIKITLSHCVGIRAADGWQTYLLFFLKSLFAIFLLFYINFFILWYQFWHQKLMIMPWQHCCLANQQAYLLTKVVVFYLFIVLYGLFLWNLAPETWSFQKVL